METNVLAVRFYEREVENEYLTNAEGRPIRYMADFVRIEIPGNMTSIIDTFANDDHKKRFPQEWAHFNNFRSTEAIPAGTPLKDWPLLTAAQASELRHFKFYTVEQVAAASDTQINTLGMMTGMSPFAFREKAKAFLDTAKGSASAMQQAEELKKRDIEIQTLKQQMNELMQRFSAPKEDAPRRGRPPKQEQEAA